MHYQFIYMMAFILLSWPARAQDSDERLMRAAAFILSEGREDFVRGTEEKSMTRSGGLEIIYQMDRPCVFQYRNYVFVGGKRVGKIVQVDFQRMRRWWIGTPPLTYSPRLQLSGERLGWCEVEDVPQDIFKDRSWSFSAIDDAGCSGFVERKGYPNDLVRMRDAFVYIGSNFCAFSGKPY